MAKSQSSWHWKANITLYNPPLTKAIVVAILMTLEGEYYYIYVIGRRPTGTVAILMTLEGEYYTQASLPVQGCKVVAILMTLEGEYY